MSRKPDARHNSRNYMPFSFQLHIEFFLPGMVLFCSFALLAELFYRAEITATLAFLASGPATSVILVVFVIGLGCYFLGTVANAVGNRLIRVLMAGYRRRIIRRKLALQMGQSIEALPESERAIISSLLPRVRSQSADDKLNEVYAAARSFCSLWSERSAKAIDYHWALVRLARATLLPIVFLNVVFLVRFISHTAHAANGLGLLVSFVLLALTFMTYRYREKFLIYTVFDILFLSSIQRDKK